MKYLIVKKSVRPGFYIYDKTNDRKLGILECFLSEIDFDEMDKYVAWAKDKKQDSYGTNTTYIDKYTDEVCITMDADGSEFRMPLEEFIKLLEQWKECVSKNPERIIITQENNEFNCKPLEN